MPLRRPPRRSMALLAGAVVAASLVQTAPAYAESEPPVPVPGPPIMWDLNPHHPYEELSREFDRDEDGRVDLNVDAANRLRDILRPEQASIWVDVCSADPAPVEVTWQLARVGEEPLPAVTTTECRTDLVLPDRIWPEARTYDVSATLRFAEGPEEVRAARAKVRDVFIAGLGDSYGSGEGNPVDLDGKEWDNDRCHRSRLSGQEQGARQFDEIRGVNVTFLHVACSGAKAAEGIMLPYKGLIERDPPLPPQLDQVAEYVDLARTGTTTRQPDALVLSIGGNDANFSTVVENCLLKPPYYLVPVPFPPYLVPIPAKNCNEKGEKAREAFDQGIAALPALYDQLDAEVRAKVCQPPENCKLIITEYPDGSTNSEGEACWFHPIGFSKGEFQWVIDEVATRLNEEMIYAASRNGWRYAHGVRERFDGHGICADDDWMRDIFESIEIQGDKWGAFHPDSAGHLYGYAPAIVNSLRGALGFTLPGPTPTPLHASFGPPKPPVCDLTTDDGKDELYEEAPPADLAPLRLPDGLEFEVRSALGNAFVGASSCTSNTRVIPPGDTMPARIEIGRTGCPTGVEICHNGDAATAAYRFPVFGDETPVVEASATADASLRSSEEPGTDRHRSALTSAFANTAFVAVAPEGQDVAVGELVVDLTPRVQATGARARAGVEYSLALSTFVPPRCDEYGACEGWSTDRQAGVELTLERESCQESAQHRHGCKTEFGHDSARENTERLYAWSGDTVLADVDRSSVGGTGGAILTHVLGHGLASPTRTIRIPYSVPVGEIVLARIDVGASGLVQPFCAEDHNRHACSASGVVASKITVLPGDGGALVPLPGFQPPPDDTPPQIAATPTGESGENGWFVGPVQVALDATDDNAGVATIRHSLDGGPETVVDAESTTVAVDGDGQHTVTATATDWRDNVSDPMSVSVGIDTTPPTIDLGVEDGAVVDEGAEVPTGLACDDGTSGVEACEGPAALDTRTPGEHTATFTAVDRAGHTTTRRLTYEVRPAAPVTTDHVSIDIPELGFTVEGDLTGGDLTIVRDKTGRPKALNGVAELAGPEGGTTTVTFKVRRTKGNLWRGTVRVVDPASGTSVKANAGDGVPVTEEPDRLAGSFRDETRDRTVHWTVHDRA